MKTKNTTKPTVKRTVKAKSTPKVKAVVKPVSKAVKKSSSNVLVLERPTTVKYGKYTVKIGKNGIQLI